VNAVGDTSSSNKRNRVATRIGKKDGTRFRKGERTNITPSKRIDLTAREANYEKGPTQGERKKHQWEKVWGRRKRDAEGNIKGLSNLHIVEGAFFLIDLSKRKKNKKKDQGKSTIWRIGITPIPPALLNARPPVKN